MKQKKSGQTLVVYADEISPENHRKEGKIVGLNITPVKFRPHKQADDRECEEPTEEKATPSVVNVNKPVATLIVNTVPKPPSIKMILIYSARKNFILKIGNRIRRS